MKELSIEEKAERYDEAIEELRGLLEGIHEEKCDIMEEDIIKIFPELAESEDERIKEWLINLVKGHIEWLEDRIREQLSNGQVYGGELVKAKNSLAWLEKQCEKGTNGNEREIPNLEPPLTIKHAREVMGIKQGNAWSEEDERHFSWIIEHLGQSAGLYDNLIDWLKSIKERYTWKPSDEQMGALENVRKILHTNKEIYSKANNLMYDFEELIRTLKKLREE